MTVSQLHRLLHSRDIGSAYIVDRGKGLMVSNPLGYTTVFSSHRKNTFSSLEVTKILQFVSF